LCRPGSPDISSCEPRSRCPGHSQSSGRMMTSAALTRTTSSALDCSCSGSFSTLFTNSRKPPPLLVVKSNQLLLYGSMAFDWSTPKRYSLPTNAVGGPHNFDPSSTINGSLSLLSSFTPAVASGSARCSGDLGGSAKCGHAAHDLQPLSLI